MLCYFVFFASSPAVNVSLEVYPSDEELFEAFLRGDIDYQTYINLAELFENGIDSTELYLLEEIPNINYFLESYINDYSRLEWEQAESFIIEDARDEKKTAGFFRARSYRKLEENGGEKNHFYLKSALNEQWSLDARFSDNYTGEKEWGKRSVVYRSRKGAVRKIIFGNFTTRFGLGLSVGYRGKLLSKDEPLSEETLLFPDYGGFNGLYLEGGRTKDAMKALVHHDQNQMFRISAGAFDFMTKYKHFQWEGIVLGSIVENRLTDVKYRHYQLGSFVKYKRNAFNAAVEMAFPVDALSSSPAALFESKFSTDEITVKLSAWHYGDDFINLTGGGRAGSFYRTVSVDTVDYEFRDKRVDQRGILLRSKVVLGYDVQHEFILSVYGQDRYRNFVKLVSAFEIPVTAGSLIRFDIRSVREKDVVEILTESEFRLEYRLKQELLDLRSYLGFTRDKADRKYLSYFMRLKNRFRGFGLAELWLNLARVDRSSGHIDYFYAYIREALNLSAALEVGAKYSYRYNRRISDREQSILQLEAKLKW